MNSLTRPFLVFRVGEAHYALAIEEVTEVAALMTVLPLMGLVHPALLGMVIRQGEPLALLDLRRLFGVPALIDRNTLFVVAQHPPMPLGFVVDAVQGVVYFEQHALHSAPNTGGQIRGLLRHDAQWVQWLALEALSNLVLAEPADRS